MLKKFLAIILTITLTLALVPMSVFAVGNTADQAQATLGDNGNCGTYDSGSDTYNSNATFPLDQNGVLTITVPRLGAHACVIITE